MSLLHFFLFVKIHNTRYKFRYIEIFHKLKFILKIGENDIFEDFIKNVTKMFILMVIQKYPHCSYWKLIYDLIL